MRIPLKTLDGKYDIDSRSQLLRMPTLAQDEIDMPCFAAE